MRADAARRCVSRASRLWDRHFAFYEHGTGRRPWLIGRRSGAWITMAVLVDEDAAVEEMVEQGWWG